jgi:ubiquinone/menaquinone biosynthesis C-methylase UbiE
MSDKGSEFLFNTIAPVYGLFFDFQVRKYQKVVRDNMSLFNGLETVLDIGCGTGALCFVLDEVKMDVTGVEPAEKMLKIAKDRNKLNHVKFIQANILERLPFEDKSFDITIASYVAHGMKVNDRIKMYQEMNRVTKNKVIFYDYNSKRSLLSDIAEWLENGDYFNFIQVVENEMKEFFKDVEIINVDRMASLYVCTPNG